MRPIKKLPPELVDEFGADIMQYGDWSKLKLTDQITRLEKEKDKAISDNNFELACQLRDQVRALKRSLQK